MDSEIEVEMSRVIDALPGYVWTARSDGHIEFVNQSWREYTGLTLEDASSTDWQSAIHPEDLSKFVAHWQARLNSGEWGEAEIRVKRFDGVYRWFSVTGFPLRNAEGEIVRWCVQQTDVDDQKRAAAMFDGEKRLLEMVARGFKLSDVLDELCRTVEGIAVGCRCSVLLLDPNGTSFVHGAGPSLPADYNQVFDGKFVDRNYGPCSLAASIKTQVLASDVASDIRWKASPWPNLAMSHGLRSCWSTPILSGDQKVLGVFALYQGQPQSPTALQQDLIGQFTAIASIAIERAQSDAALKQSEARKAAILDSALDCIVTIDHDGRITEFNPAAERTFGYRRDQVIGEQLADVIIPPSMRDQHRRGFARYLATGDAHVIGRHIEMAAVRADGSEFPVELTITHIPSEGPPSFTGYLRDITQRKRSEAALEEVRSELDQMSRVTSLSALTASIAHEVNQPLAGIITNASTCLRMLAADPPNVEGAQETARRTIRDGNRASDVIKRLRALFGKKGATTEPMDLNDAAREVIALSRNDLQKNMAALWTDLADDLPMIEGDRIQLQQVILNLLLNAAEAMNDVNDRPRRVGVSTQRDGEDCVRLTVRDSGVGFGPQGVERLFEAFHTTKSEGMGIGLSVSRSIIESHHGRIWAEPNDGPGATFSFTIPLYPMGRTAGTVVPPH